MATRPNQVVYSGVNQMNELQNPNQRRLSYHTAIDNNGVEQTLTYRQWSEHEDTFAYDGQGRIRHVTPDMIRHKSYQQLARGYTDRQVAYLDPVRSRQGSQKNKRKVMNPDFKNDLVNRFLMRGIA